MISTRATHRHVQIAVTIAHMPSVSIVRASGFRTRPSPERLGE